MEGTIGEVRIFAGSFTPLSWAICDGSLLSIAQNDALFSILGTTYGGDGEVTFALPDLRGRVPVGAGQGRDLSQYDLGEQTGSESVAVAPTGVASGSAMVNVAEGSTPSNIQPVLGVNYIICLQGLYPTRQ